MVQHKEIDSKQLEIARGSMKLKVFPTIHGSSVFQVVVFKQHSNFFKASHRLCFCETCQEDYGSCGLFNQYHLNHHELNQIYLRSYLPAPSVPTEGDSVDSNFIAPESIVAVAADTNAMDTIWFLKVKDINCVSINDSMDDCGHIIPKGMTYIKGNFLEVLYHSTKCTLYLSCQGN